MLPDGQWSYAVVAMRIRHSSAGHETAGFVASEEDGRVERPFPSFGLVVPEHLQLDKSGERLVWAWGDERLVDTPNDLLTRFLRLGLDEDGQAIPAPTPEILAFARAFGPLDAWRLESPEAWPAFWVTLPRRWDSGEPVAHWHFYLSAMRAVLRIAAALRDRERPPHEAFDAMGVPRGSLDTPYPHEMVDETVNRWLVAGGVAPQLRWCPAAERRPDVEPTIYIDASSLLGVLALQLAQVVSGIAAWGVCRGCGLPFPIPTGRKGGPRPRYCTAPTCGNPARSRLASARWYRKHKNGGPP